MAYHTLMPILIPFLLISKEALSVKKVSSARPENATNKMWVSRIVSEHIWDYRITSKTNPECTRDFEIYRRYLDSFTTWAVQMFDSSALVPGGFLVGDNYNLGNFEECINTQVPEELGFSAQYCLPTFKFTRTDAKKTEIPDKWDGLVWGRLQTSKQRSKAPKDVFNLAFCIPSTCSSDDLQSSLQTLLEGPMRDAGYELNVTMGNLLCTMKDTPSETTGRLLMRYFINGMTSVLLICSAADLLLAIIKGKNYDIKNCSLRKTTGIEKLLLPFSIYRNIRQFATPPTSPEDYKILHGIKTVLIVLTIVAHRGMGCNKTALVNWNYFENRIQDFSIFYSAMPIPDIFFCISGFLSCISILKQLERNTFNVWAHLVNKLLRVLPPYMFVIACTVFILPYLGNGPLWRTTIEPEVEYCRNGWWANLLFINNYYNLGQYCLPQSYYVAADMHFFVVGSIIVYFCWRWESSKMVILGAAFFLSFLLPFMTVYRNNYEGLLKIYHDFLINPRSHEVLINMYMKSHNRFGGYVTGIIGAFLFRRLQKTGYKFSKITSWAGVLTGVFIIVAVSFFRHLLHGPTEAYSLMVHALYAGLHTQLLGIGFLTIIIIQITTGFGDLDPLFLALDCLVPLSRLSYWSFLLNFQIMLVLMGSHKTPMHMTYEKLTYGGQHWGDVILTYYISVYCYLLIEAPINHIKPMILQYITRGPPSTTKKER